MKKKIGILLGQSSIYEKEIYRGAKQAALENNDDLIVFFGGHFGANQVVNGGVSPFYKTALYSYINKMNIDILLIPVSTILQNRLDLREQFFSSFNVPIVLIGQAYEGYPSVHFNNKSVYAAVTYMVERGCKNIAFIGGREDGNATGKRRYYYKKALTDHGMDVNDDLICYAKNYTEYNEEIIMPFLMAHPEIDAIMAATDPLALCVYECLDKLRRVVGEDVLVCGFDDNVESKEMTPPLSSCRADPFILGYNAAMNVNEPVVLDSQFILRQSMSGQSFSNMDHQMSDQEKCEYILEMAPEATHPLRLYLERLFNNIDIYHDIHTFRNELDIMIESEYGYLINQDKLYEVLEPEYRIVAIDKYKSVEQNKRLSQNNKVTRTSELIKKIAQLDLNLARKERYESELKSIYHYRVYTFNEPRQFTGREFEVDDVMVEILRLHHQRLVSDPKTIATKYILSEMNHENIVVTPIYSNEMQYGIMIANTDFDDVNLYEMLATIVSSSIHTYDLIDRFSKYAIYDSLTNVLNFRGIDNAAAALKAEDGPYQLMICDLNNLKYINDHYSHQYGNLAIIGVAEVLKSVFEDGVIGRFGGDEFVVIAKDINQKIEEMQFQMDQYNEKFKYPFEITFAYGSTVWNIEDENIRLAMDRADTNMYVKKKEMKGSRYNYYE